MKGVQKQDVRQRLGTGLDSCPHPSGFFSSTHLIIFKIRTIRLLV